jgi:hypothetical protein
LHLVLPPADDIAIASDHGIKADLGHIRRILDVGFSAFEATGTKRKTGTSMECYETELVSSHADALSA